MQANELRIGNLVEVLEPIAYGARCYSKTGKHGIIKEIRGYKIQINQENHVFIRKYSSIKPIPLTEEWLIKFGFNKDIDDYVLELKHILFVSYNDDDYVHVKNMALDIIISIKYVHQLQNLYFVLTGSELEYKK